jgi:hypothetical protein
MTRSWFWLVVALAGCGVAANKRSVARADLPHPERTRITGYEADYTGWHETTPGQVPRTAVMDEAFLESDATRDCAVITLRTHLDRDDSLSRWKASINGEQAYVERELVAVSDYTIHGERVVVDAAYATPFAHGSLQITQPTTNVWRVIERTARICQPHSDELELELSYSKSTADPTRRLVYSWALN